MKRNNIQKCRILRKSQTDAERKLWSILRNRQLCGIKFRRQFSIDRYILDFYSPEYKLGIEADGGQHYSSFGKQKDKIRSKRLSESSIKILRFSDLEILKNSKVICEVIQNEIEKRRPLALHTPHPSLSPRGRGIKY
ncbi:MAG: hypothetical protein DDT41_00243 [candidate division WS2 bacterium]|nr:hypothetical protein [Candidatus Psychracetigena formicireducens]